MKVVTKVISVMILFFVLSAEVCAAEQQQIPEAVSVTLEAGYGETAVCDMQFQMYLIARMDETGGLQVVTDWETLENDIKKCLTGKQEWQELAETVALEQKDISEKKAQAVVRTNADGIGYAENIERGLYLVVASEMEQGGYLYRAAPFFVTVPTQNPVNQDWEKETKVCVKTERETMSHPETGEGRLLEELLAVMGISLLVVGRIVYRKRQKH